MKTQMLELASDRPIVQEPVAPVMSAFKVGDIAYIFFRHKGKILVCTLLGLVVAAVIWRNAPVTYISEAKILIRYVLQNRSADRGGVGDQVKLVGGEESSPLGPEVEMIRSYDLATEVAAAVGATNLLGTLGIPITDQGAVAAVRSGIEVKIRPKSSILNIGFKHPNPAVTGLVVTNLIREYQKMHVRIHRALDALGEVGRQRDLKRDLVEKTEKELLEKKAAAGIVSIQDSQQTLGRLIAEMRSKVMNVDLELAESREALARLTNSAPAEVAITSTTPKSTNALVREVDTDKIDITKLYQGVLSRIEALRRREQELLLQFLPTSKYVTRVSAQIFEAQAERDRLIDEHPELIRITLSPAGTVAGDQTQPAPTRAQLVKEAAAKVEFLEGRLKDYDVQLKKLLEEALTVSDKGLEIAQLERKLQIGEKQYTFLATRLEEARDDPTQTGSQLPNIAVFQGATPPRRFVTPMDKMVLVSAVGGLGLGLALAILIEFFTDESVRRPRHVSESLNLPLYLSLPKLKDLPQSALSNGLENGEVTDHPEGTGESAISRYSEALRDRLIMHFQIRDLTHKPKLIGVTSCGKGAGVTTLATSLAATLSETGEGNVLYVDVNQNGGPSVHPFRKGKPVVGIGEALAVETRSSAMVSENLYMVSLGDPHARRFGVLPKRLANLVPQMKASDYDYIIFDLPPVSQTSATVRVSGLLDITLMVLESEKTHRDLARQAVALLAESNTQMVAVLNKHRRYLPRRLDGDL